MTFKIWIWLCMLMMIYSFTIDFQYLVCILWLLEKFCIKVILGCLFSKILIYYQILTKIFTKIWECFITGFWRIEMFFYVHNVFICRFACDQDCCYFANYKKVFLLSCYQLMKIMLKCLANYPPLKYRDKTKEEYRK